VSMKAELKRFVNTDLNSWLFFISYTVYLFVSIINTSFFVVDYQFAMGTKLLILSILLLICKEIINTPRSTKEKLGVLLGFAFLLVINFTIGDVVTDSVTWIVVFIICARDIDFEKVVKLTIVVSSILLAVIVFSSFAGIIQNHFDSYVARPRHWVGFRYASFGPTLLFNISALVVYIRKEKLGKLELLILGPANVALFILTNSRLPFYLTILVMVFAYLSQYRTIPADKLKPLWMFLVISPLIFGAVCLWAGYHYDPNVTKWANLNATLSGRLRLEYTSLTTRGVKWWPRAFPMSTDGGVFNPGYNFIDSLYILVLQEYGIIFSILFMAIVIYGLWKMYQREEYYLLFVSSAYALYAIIDQLILGINYNTFWLALGVALFATEHDKDFLTANTRHIPISEIESIIGSAPARPKSMVSARRSASQRARMQSTPLKPYKRTTAASRPVSRNASDTSSQAAEIARQLRQSRSTQNIPSEKTTNRSTRRYRRH
jgi:hypothetical protein